MTYVAPKRMRKADAPVPPHVAAIAEQQRQALAERMAKQAEEAQGGPVALPPIAPRRRRKPSNRRRSI